MSRADALSKLDDALTKCANLSLDAEQWGTIRTLYVIAHNNLTWDDSEHRQKWYVVPDYRPNGDPATSATIVDRAGQHVAQFDRIADAEAAVDAVNGRNHDTA